jgi:hypothetical protein
MFNEKAFGLFLFKGRKQKIIRSFSTSGIPRKGIFLILKKRACVTV